VYNAARTVNWINTTLVLIISNSIVYKDKWSGMNVLISFLQEFTRSSLQAEANLPDVDKPKPETILTSFMNDSEYGSIIAKLNPEKEISLANLSPAEEAERIEQCIQSLNDVCGSVAFDKAVDSSGMKDNDLIVTSDLMTEKEGMRNAGQSTSQEVSQL
jgi:hypothetical protein